MTDKLTTETRRRCSEGEEEEEEDDGFGLLIQTRENKKWVLCKRESWEMGTPTRRLRNWLFAFFGSLSLLSLLCCSVLFFCSSLSSLITVLPFLVIFHFWFIYRRVYDLNYNHHIFSTQRSPRKKGCQYRKASWT